jgi:hypothetical protein
MSRLQTKSLDCGPSALDSTFLAQPYPRTDYVVVGD